MSNSAAATARAPDIAGEILGYRAWYAQTRDRGPQRARLISPQQETPWPAREWLVAVCDECEQPPGEECSCGIHAARDREHMDGLNIVGIDRDDPRLILGEVALAGGVIPGNLGYRGERARPVRLWIPYAEWQLGTQLRDAYGVQIVLFNPFEEGEAEWT